MLAEFLADQGDWTSVMPGARACLFSLDERPFPLPLQLEHLHFETLFCLRGSVTLTRQDGSFLKAGAQQVLLLTDLAGFTGARVDAPLEGVLVAVDARGARESLKSICNLLGGLTLDTGRVRRWMASQGGCAVVGPTHWSRAAFADLDSLPKSERARWCVWKSVELLYL
ncbi:MAG: AraC family transcriptional regulator, partial [Acutalibacter sp.]